MRPENTASDFNAHCLLARHFAIYAYAQLVNHADIVACVEPTF